MKIPDYMPRASEAVDESAEIIERLLDFRSLIGTTETSTSSPEVFRIWKTLRT